MADTGISALEKTLIGVESPAGTGTPTTHWRGMAKKKDRLEMVFPPEKVGKFGGTLRSYIPKTGGEVELSGDATFEQMAYIFNSAIYGTTPTTDASSAQIRTWNIQTLSSDPYSTTDLNTLVVQNGDNIAVEDHNFCFTREYVLAGKQGDAWNITATLQSRAPTTDTFAAVGDTDLQNPAETMLFSKTLLYIDPSTDTPGTTLKSGTLLEASLKHTTGWVARDAKDGRLDFSDIKRVDDDLTLDIKFEHNGIAVAERDAWRAQTERVIQLKVPGTALSTTDAGAPYDTKIMVLNLYGKWMTFGADGFEEQNGDNIYSGTFKIGYSSLAAVNKAQFILATELATLP